MHSSNLRVPATPCTHKWSKESQWQPITTSKTIVLLSPSIPANKIHKAWVTQLQSNDTLLIYPIYFFWGASFLTQFHFHPINTENGTVCYLKPWAVLLLISQSRPSPSLWSHHNFFGLQKKMTWEWTHIHLNLWCNQSIPQGCSHVKTIHVCAYIYLAYHRAYAGFSRTSHFPTNGF